MSLTFFAVAEIAVSLWLLVAIWQRVARYKQKLVSNPCFLKSI